MPPASVSPGAENKVKERPLFSSIKMKMLCLVVGIMAVTAVVLMLHTKREVGEQMLWAEEKSIQNAIYLTKLDLENQYKGLLYHKMTALVERKKEMRSLSAMAISTLESIQRMLQGGVLTVPEEETKTKALAWIKAVRYGKNARFFVYDERAVILSHPVQKYEGKNMWRVRDTKGLNLLQSMLERSKKEGGAFTTYYWDEEGETSEGMSLGYFCYFPRWKWVVATSVDIEDIDVETKKSLNNIVEGLKESLPKIHIARTGHLFLFNGKRQILVPFGPATDAVLNDVNPATGNPLITDLMDAAKNPERPLKYVWKDPNFPELDAAPYASYVTYFKTLDWYIASIAREEEIERPARDLVLRQILFISIIFILGACITYLLVNGISQPLKKLTEYAKQLPKQDFTASERASSEIERLPARYRDEVGRLAQSFLFMEDSLRQYIRDLRDTTAAKERIESELKIARDIQMSIVPKIFPPFPDRPEFDLFAALQPAKEVGGDFYDFFLIDEDHLFFTVGDVSGKGVPASLFMAVTKTLLRASVVGNDNPQAVLAHVNNNLCEGNDACMFVTVFCGILNIRTGDVLCTCGGHNPPVHCSEGGAEYLETPDGMSLGVMEDMEYGTLRFRLKPGDTLFMYSDGVTEATDPDDQLFSDEYLRECLLEIGDLPVKELTKAMMERIDAFAKEAPQADDITILVLKFNG